MATGNWWDALPEAQNPTPPPGAPAPPESPAGTPLASPAPALPWYSNLPEAQNATPGTPPQEDKLLPNARYDITDMLAHTLSFGATDPMRAAIGASRDWMFGAPNATPGMPPAGFDFNKRWEEVARGRRQFEAEHPYQAGVATLGGTLAFPPASVAKLPVTTTAEAPSLLRDWAKSVPFGIGAGAATGAADNPEDPLRGTVTGAGFGLGGGLIAPVATRAVSSTGRKIGNWWDPAGNATENATTKLNSLINDDIKNGVAPPLSVADARLGDTQAPLSLADIYPSVKRHLGVLYDSASPASGSIFTQLNQRDQAAGQRLIGTTERTVASGPSNFLTDQALHVRQQTAARPAYSNFEMASAPNPDLFAPNGKMTALLRRPVAKQGMRQALDIAANNGENPNTLGIAFNAAGDPVFIGVPSWRTLDYVKQGMDSALNTNLRNPITGKLNLDSAGRAQMGAQQDFVKLMDRENPLYAPARAAYSGPASSIRALELGSDFRDHAQDQQQYILGTLSPADRQFYQLGAANRIKNDIQSTVDTGDEAKKIANSAMMRERLRPAFDSDTDYNQFMAHVNDERSIFQTGVDITGNSATARRMGAMSTATPPSPVSMAIPAAAISLASGGTIPHAVSVAGMTAGGHMATNAFNRAWQAASGNSPEMQNALTSFALAPGQAGRQVIGLLGSPTNRLAVPSWLPGTALSSQIPSFLQADPKGLLSSP